MNDQSGYEVIQAVFSASEVDALRAEADRVAADEGEICVRHLTEKSPAFAELAAGERLQSLLPAGLSLVRSILFDKTPEKNWPVSWHQDLTIAVQEKVEVSGYDPWSVKDGAVHVQPPVELLEQMWTLRVHLDDTPASNGALQVVAGSHRLGKLAPEQIADAVKEGGVVTCACAAGDVLLMSPLLLHASKRSTNPDRRRILHFEFAPLDALADVLRWA